MTYPLDPAYVVQPARVDLANAIHRLIVETETVESGDSSGFSLAELQDDLTSLDLERDTWVVFAPDGNLAGYGYMRHRRHVRMDLEVYVHPEHTGRGIGTTLVRLGDARAREHIDLAPPDVRVVMHNWINAQNTGACQLLEREGFLPYRYFFRMEAELAGDLPEPEWPTNIRVQECVGGRDERTFYKTLEEAMADHWGHIPATFDEWIERRTRGGFDPSIWYLAVDGDEPAGAAVCTISDDVGWIDYIGVRPPWRKRGIGMALLRHAAREFGERGLRRMALGVDAANPTGATRLYERAGMRVAQRHATYGKELRPGKEPGGLLDVRNKT